MTRQFRYLVPAWIVAFSIGLLVAISGNSARGLVDRAPPASPTAPTSSCPIDHRSEQPNLSVAMALDLSRRPV